MFTKRSVHFFLGLFLLSGCGAISIDGLCEEVAEAQCNKCIECADRSDGAFSGGDLCPNTGLNLGCVEALTARCVDQSATLDQAKDELNVCQDEIENGELTCDLLSAAFAQNQAGTTPECRHFFE